MFNGRFFGVPHLRMIMYHRVVSFDKRFFLPYGRQNDKTPCHSERMWGISYYCRFDGGFFTTRCSVQNDSTLWGKGDHDDNVIPREAGRPTRNLCCHLECRRDLKVLLFSPEWQLFHFEWKGGLSFVEIFEKRFFSCRDRNGRYIIKQGASNSLDAPCFISEK